MASASAVLVAVPPGWLRDVQRAAQGVPPLPVLGQVDGRRARAEDELGRQGTGQLERRLAPERHDDTHHPAPGPLLGVEHIGHVLRRQGLEVEPVGGVVVRRDRLGIAVDHDGLVAGVAQRHGRVDTAVVELDPLPDAVRSRAEDDDPVPGGGADLVLLLVGRVVVGRERLELGRAGVDGLERRPHAEGEALAADLRRARPAQVGQLVVGEAQALGPPEAGPIEERGVDDRLPGRRDAADLLDEPRVDTRAGHHVGGRYAAPERRLQLEDPVRRGHGDAVEQRGVIELVEDRLGRVGVQPGPALLQGAQGLLQGLAERPPDGHDLADRLHAACPTGRRCRGVSRRPSAAPWSPRSRSSARRRPAWPG